MLLFGGSGQVDPGCFNAFVSHKVCKQRNIIKLCQKILGKPMPERVRINLFRGDLISFCQYFQLEIVTPLAVITVSVSACENTAGSDLTFLQLVLGFLAESSGKINPPHFSAF